MISFNCPECDASLKVPDDKAGAKARCKSCGEIVRIPEESENYQPAPAPVKSAKRAPAKEETPKPVKRRSAPPPRKRGGPNMMIVGGVLAGGLAVAAIAVIAVVVMNGSSSKPTQQQPPPEIAGGGGGGGGAASRFRFGAPTAAAPTTKAVAQTTGGTSDPGETFSGPRDLGARVRDQSLAFVTLIFTIEKNGFGQATGTLVDQKNGLVLTNNHVAEGAEQIFILFPFRDANGRTVDSKDAYLEKVKAGSIGVLHARSLRRDPKRDLALLKLENPPPEQYKAVALSDKEPASGETVHSIGNAAVSNGLWRYLTGRVGGVYHVNRGKGNIDCMMIETDTKTTHGDSGGPLLNDRAQLVGITQGAQSLVGDNVSVSLFIDLSEIRQFITETCANYHIDFQPGTDSLPPPATASMATLLARLDDKDANKRASAAQQLSVYGSEAKTAVPKLLKLLKEDSDDAVVSSCLDTLEKIGAPEKSAVSSLTESLRHPKKEVRRYATNALGRLGKEARRAEQALTEKAQKDTDNVVRENAVRALGQIAPDDKPTLVRALTTLVDDPDLGVRVAAAEALASLRPLDAGDLPTFTGMLKPDKDPQVRGCAAAAVGKMGPAAASAGPALLEACGGADAALRGKLIEALTQIGYQDPKAVPMLVQALGDQDKDLKKKACAMLAKLGPEGKAAVEPLAGLLSDNDHDLAKSAAMALAKMGRAAKPAVNGLADLLKPDADSQLCSEALVALEAIGPGAKDAIPQLLELLNRRDLHAKLARVFAKIGAASVKDLAGELDSEYPDKRIGAAKALGELGATARPVVRKLGQHRRDDLIPQVRDACAEALAKINTK